MTRQKSIRCVVCRVGAEPTVELVADLEGFRAVVGGTVEGVWLDGALILYCNDLGIDRGLPRNRCGILGNFIVCRYDDEGHDIDLSDEDLDRVIPWALAYRDVRHSNDPNPALVAARSHMRYQVSPESVP